MSAHTPGGWTWVIHDYSMATLRGPKGDEEQVMAVAPCDSCMASAKLDGQWKWGRCQVPNEANARLIASAPELLQALNAFVFIAPAALKALDVYPEPPVTDDISSALALGRAAIAKATGRSP